MAETSIRTCLVLAFFIVISAEASKVTFVGFLNDVQNKQFSALLEVELSAEDNAFSGRGLWLASKDYKSCTGRAVYGRARVDPEPQSPLSQQFNSEIRTLQLLLPLLPDHEERTLYLCTRGAGSRWKPLGFPSEFLLPKVTDVQVLNEENEYILEPVLPADRQRLGVKRGQRQSRALEDEEEANGTIDATLNAVASTNILPRILALTLRKVTKDVSYADDGQIEALEGKSVPLNLFGLGLTNDSEVAFSLAGGSYGSSCNPEGELHVKTKNFEIVGVNDDGTMGTIDIPSEDLVIVGDAAVYYVCLRTSSDGEFIHQGDDSSNLRIKVTSLLAPIWVMVILLVILLCLSGLFSGLNLGLMALDQTELKIVQNTGSEKEKEYANKIFPIRSHGNFLLCSLLLGNVLVNNTLTILLDTLTSGLVAVIGATMGIVVFGEIIPQAICSRHGLAVGAYTIWLTKLFMILTFPLSYPISKLLDCVLGDEIGTVYDKKKLIELLKVTNEENDLEKEEVDIVTGALVYKEKTVRSVMTKLEDVYMLPLNSILNFETVSEIREQGYSRIPVFENETNNIVHILFAKDLMFIDPDDNMPLSMVCAFYQNDVNFVFHDTTLNVMFNEFKSGERGHMAFVQIENTGGPGDPFYETIGLVTLEDIIEEIIQQEIVDETDAITDNRTKKKRRRENFKSGSEGTNFHRGFGEGPKKIAISPQMTLAVFQYLSTTIEPFMTKHGFVSEVVLKRLLTMDVYREIKIKKETTTGNKCNVNEEELIIMTKGKPIDYFVLIIEGKVAVDIGRENLKFESGPFTYFGIQTLNQVIESPSSPLLTYKQNSAGTPSSTTSADLRNLRKASTQQSIDVPNSILTNKRSSTAGEIGLVGSAHQHTRSGSVVPTYQPFIPDYTIKAVTDVLYLKIKRMTYLRALKASMMGKKATGHSGEINERELENLLEKVNEDESMDHDLNMMLRTPLAHSPNNSASEHEVTRVRVTSSGASTPTLANRGDPVRMSLVSKRSEIEGEFWVNKPDTEVSVTVTGGGGSGVGSGTGTATAGAGNGSLVGGNGSLSGAGGPGGPTANQQQGSNVGNGGAVKDTIDELSNKSESGADNNSSASNEVRTTLLNSSDTTSAS